MSLTPFIETVSRSREPGCGRPKKVWVLCFSLCPNVTSLQWLHGLGAVCRPRANLRPAIMINGTGVDCNDLRCVVASPVLVCVDYVRGGGSAPG